MVAKYVATTIPKTKDQFILNAQHFNSIYAQSKYLYRIIPDDPRHRYLNQAPSRTSHFVDELIGDDFYQENILQPHISMPYTMTQ